MSWIALPTDSLFIFGNGNTVKMISFRIPTLLCKTGRLLRYGIYSSTHRRLVLEYRYGGRGGHVDTIYPGHFYGKDAGRGSAVVSWLNGSTVQRFNDIMAETGSITPCKLLYQYFTVRVPYSYDMIRHPAVECRMPSRPLPFPSLITNYHGLSYHTIRNNTGCC